jgi:hypothetical protein
MKNAQTLREQEVTVKLINYYKFALKTYRNIINFNRTTEI